MSQSQKTTRRCQAMATHRICPDYRDNPGNPLVLDDEAMDDGANNPVVIGKV